MATDPEQNWVATGTSCGHMTVWDIRFQLPINSWQYCNGKRTHCAIVVLCASSAIFGHVIKSEGGGGD